jgi:hypothetical protein
LVQGKITYEWDLKVVTNYDIIAVTPESAQDRFLPVSDFSSTRGELHIGIEI